MSSNVISIRATKDTSTSEGGDIKYQITVMANEPINNKSEDSASVCNSKGTNKDWVKLNIFQQTTLPFEDKANMEDGNDSQFKCVLLLKSSIKKKFLSWYQATKMCANLGGSLIKIENEAEQQALQNFVMKR